MKSVFLIFLVLIHFSISVEGQLNIKNPQICHDRNNFLTCYNDGQIILKFGNGDFKEFISADSSVKYSEADRTITFYRRSYSNPLLIDTVYVTQLPKSIMLKKRASSLEINSLADIPASIREFHIGAYSINNTVKGLSFGVGEKSFVIEIWTYEKTWSWDIKMWQEDQILAFLYNKFLKNRLSHIVIKDFALKYGMAVGTTYRSLKKIRRLESVYVDTMTFEGRTVIGDYPLDKYYYYDYNKRGKLKSYPPVVGELKLCDCN
jgi:hypothetical protein